MDYLRQCWRSYNPFSQRIGRSVQAFNHYMKHVMKKIIMIFLIALVHLGVSKTVVAIALAGTSGNAFDGEMSMWVKMLIWTTKVLYFPVISLSLYSRQWFPGKLIYIPIFTNSLLWAAVIYFAVRYFSKILKR